jgi:hypothetical protein
MQRYSYISGAAKKSVIFFIAHAYNLQKQVPTFNFSYKNLLGIVGNLRVDPKRLFTADDKVELLSRLTPDDNGRYECAVCNQHFAADELTVDHIDAWSTGGRTVLSNAQLVCRACNSRKGNK